MGNPICEKCEPAEPEKIDGVVENMKCADLYKTMNDCMKLHNGNIASCKLEWSAFTSCFKENNELLSRK